MNVEGLGEAHQEGKRLMIKVELLKDFPLA